MTNFIVPQLPEVERKINQHLTIITKRLLAHYGTAVSAIVLCGGFGRGEGSIVQVGSTHQPFNDYDIALITNRRISRKALPRLSRELAATLNIRFVDLGLIAKARLKQMIPTIFAYDLKRSLVIAGDQQILNSIPHFEASDIPIGEARLLLCNRIICFLELTPDGFLSHHPLMLDQHRHFVLQISKAVVAATIAYLIDAKQYRTSYQQQLNTFLGQQQISDSHKELVSMAYRLKLGMVTPDTVDPWDYWQRSFQYFMEAFNRFVLVGRTMDWFLANYPHQIPITARVVPYLKNLIKYLLYQEPMPGDERTKRLVEAAALATSLSVNRDFSINPRYWTVAQNASRRLGITSLSDWDDAKRQCTELWQRYHH